MCAHQPFEHHSRAEYDLFVLTSYCSRVLLIFSCLSKKPEIYFRNMKDKTFRKCVSANREKRKLGSREEKTRELWATPTDLAEEAAPPPTPPPFNFCRSLLPSVPQLVLICPAAPPPPPSPPIIVSPGWFVGGPRRKPSHLPRPGHVLARRSRHLMGGTLFARPLRKPTPVPMPMPQGQGSMPPSRPSLG